MVMPTPPALRDADHSDDPADQTDPPALLDTLPEAQRAELRRFDAATRQGDHAAAIAAGHALVAACPDIPALRLRLANAQGRAGDRAGQIATLQEARAAHPQNIAIVRLLARILAGPGGRDGGPKDKAALTDIARLWAAAAAAMPGDAAAAEAYARALSRTDQDEAAAAAWQDAAALAPHSAAVLEGLGRSLSRLGRDEEALPALRRALALAPERMELRQSLITMLMRLGDMAGAMAEARAALLRDPSNPLLAKRIAEIAANQSPPQAAAATKEDAAEAEPAEHATPAPGRTALAGRDGFFFYDIDAAFAQMCGPPPPADHVAAYVAAIASRAEWCAERGIAFRMLIVPERHVLYADKLPDGYTPQPERIAVQLARAHPGHVVYPFAKMMAARAEAEMCLRQDVHWTNRGAYIGYRALLASVPELAQEALELDAFTRRQRSRVGDMAIWMDLRTREAAEILIPPDPGLREIFSTKTFTTGQVDVMRAQNAPDRRLVLMRTSNSTTLIPMLAQHFGRITAIAGTNFYPELVESEAPHMVFSELPERYLAAPTQRGLRLPKDFRPGAFARDTGCDLPLPAG